jgi:hypothetical protein
VLFRPWPVGYIQAVQSHPLDSEGLVGCWVHFWILPIRLIYQLRLLVVLSVTSSWLHFCGRVDMHSCGRCWDTPDAADFRLWLSVSFFTLYALTSWFCGQVGILYCWSCFFVSHIMRSCPSLDPFSSQLTACTNLRYKHLWGKFFILSQWKKTLFISSRPLLPWGFWVHSINAAHFNC